MASSFSDQSSTPLSRASLTKTMSPRTLFSTAMSIFVFICGILALLPLLAVLSYVIFKGFSSFSITSLTQLPPPAYDTTGGGFGNAIVGTIVMVGIASLLTIPLGILAAIYLTEFSSNRVSRWIRFATNVLSGVPSILAGVFAYGTVVALFGFSAIAGGMALAILMLPIVVRTTDEALQLVSQDLRQASVGLGATNYQTVLFIVLPAALPSIITGVTLAVARAAGETAPLLFTALDSQFWFDGLTKPTASLAVLVYNFARSSSDNWNSLAWAASLILVLLVLLTSIIARWATSRKSY